MDKDKLREILTQYIARTLDMRDQSKSGHDVLDGSAWVARYEYTNGSYLHLNVFRNEVDRIVGDIMVLMELKTPNQKTD